MTYGFTDIEYEDGEVIKSAVMGDGSVRVTDILLNEDGFVGVALSSAPDNKVIGEKLNPEAEGKPVTGLGIEFQMLFDKPESIDVVIQRLQAARDHLTKGDGK